MIYKADGSIVTLEKSKQLRYTYANKLDPSTLELGWVNTSVGGDDVLNKSNGGTRSTPPIPASAGKIVTMGCVSANHYNHNPFSIARSYYEECLAYSFFNSSGKVISGQSSRPSVVGGITCPEGTSYVRVTFYDHDVTTHPENFFVYVEDVHVTEPKRYIDGGIEVLIPEDGQIWDKWGQKWTLFGDSLTADYGGRYWDMSTSSVGGKGWKEYEEPVNDVNSRIPWTGYFWASDIARRHGYIMDNRAISGTTMYEFGTYLERSGVGVLDSFITELDNGNIEEPDLITIGFGSNHAPNYIGSPDSTAKNNLYGATKYFIETLNEKCPNARKVYILHPLQSGWHDGSGQSREVMRTIYNNYNVEYVDMSQHSGITVDMLPDHLHVSSIEANKQYGRFLESYLF